MAHYGYDGSSNDSHPINYQAVVDDLRSRGGGAQPFVFTKATEATGYTNPFYAQDTAGFKAAGAAVGAYLFDHGTAVVAAEDSYFRSVVGTDMPGADDMEDPEGVNYVAHTANLLQLDPNRIVYLNQSEVAQGIPTGAGLWLAEYDGDPNAAPSYPCLIKQYTETGTVNGISGSVDLNVWCGTEAQFNAFFRLISTPNPITLEGNMIDTTPNGGIIVARPDGSVFAFDGAPFNGGLHGTPLNKPIVGLAITPSGNGYWMVGSDGGIFSFGDAVFLGSLPGHPDYNAGTEGDPCIGIAAELATSPDGYAIVCDRPQGAEPTLYRFPRDGSLAK